MSYGKTVGRNPDQADLRQWWRTPQELFGVLHSVFNFTVDACASPDNALLPRFWTKEDDAAKQSWQGERVFCNPPFGGIAPILAKAPTASVAVFLLPLTALTTRYFGQTPAPYVLIPPYRIRFTPPEGLTVRTISPSLGTVVLLFGEVASNQLVGLSSLGWLHYSYRQKSDNASETPHSKASCVHAGCHSVRYSEPVTADT